MKTISEKFFLIGFLTCMFLISSQSPAQEPSTGGEPPHVQKEASVVEPDLADISVLASKLSGHLSNLENRIASLPDVSALESQYPQNEAKLARQADQLQRLNESKIKTLDQLVQLRDTIILESESFEKTSMQLRESIRELSAWRREWQAEKIRWTEWRSSMIKDEAFDKIKPTFVKANNTIDTALGFVLQQLKSRLTLQEKAGNIQAKIYSLIAELDGLILTNRRRTLISDSPSMLSSRYFSQFGGGLWNAVKIGFDDIVWTDSRFINRIGWIVIFHCLLTLFMFITIYRMRRMLGESQRWWFLEARPFSASLFFGSLATMGLYVYVKSTPMWLLFLIIVIGISLARIVGGLNEPPERKQFVYGLVTVLIVNEVLELISLPLPLSRLYMFLTALIGLFFCLMWSRQSQRGKYSSLYGWLFRVISLLMAVIIVSELLGNHGLAYYVFSSSISSIALVVAFMLFSYMIRGGLEWLFRSPPFQRTSVMYKDTDAIIVRAKLFFDLLIWVLILIPAVLSIWKVYNTLEEATRGLLAFGFRLGSQRISVGLIMVSAGILYSFYIASWVLQKVLIDQVFARHQVESGVRHAMARLLHYVIVFFGFMLALAALGLKITELAIMLSALGVGIGFGLQGVANNFISGIILLFERPVRVGDTVEIDGRWAIIKRIGLRSTTVSAFDGADLIIPNANLINNDVTNWTLSNRRVRLQIPVGVAYGSDVPLVMETLVACGKENPSVAKIPEPEALFLRFGESSLDFELRAWVFDAGQVLLARSEIHQEIDRRFREANIVIAFPQRDLHVRMLANEIKPNSPADNTDSIPPDQQSAMTKIS